MEHVNIETRSALPIETRSTDNTDPLAQATAAVEEIRAAAETARTAHAAEVAALTTRLSAVETRMNRPGTTTEETTEPAVEQRAFVSFARGGIERMQAEEVRALTVSTDTAGGYLAPDQFVQELDRNLVLFSPMRSVARVAPASAGEIILPQRTGTLTASWGGETQPSNGTQPSYGQQKISVYELKCFVDISNTLLEDSAFNLEAELAYDFAEEFGRAEGLAFLKGDGAGKPKGLMQEADVSELVTASSTIVSAAELVTAFHELPTAYASRASWAMNRGTMGVVRKLTNTAGDFLWKDGIADGNPPTILGRPVVEMPDMDDAAAGLSPIMFGDFATGFRIFDRVNLSVLRDPYSQQTNGLVRFHARRRVGGGMTKGEAFFRIKMKP